MKSFSWNGNSPDTCLYSIFINVTLKWNSNFSNSVGNFPENETDLVQGIIITQKEWGEYK